MLHELGHYLFARLFSVDIKEFSVGMGPKIFSWVSTKTDIKYSVRLLPIGGFVSMVGEDEASDNPNALCNKPVWQRMIITAAGSISNILTGVILVLIMTATAPAIGSTVIAEFDDNAVSPDYGLIAGDEIVRVGDKKTPIWNNVTYEIGRNGVEPIDITVIRDGKEEVLHDVTFGVETEEGVSFGSIDFKVYRAEKSIGNIIKHTYNASVLTVRMIWDSIGDLISGRYGMESVSGPVGVATTIGDAARAGIHNLLYLSSIIAMNLGIFNLLPLPALDGGRLFFQLIELVRGRPVDPEYEGRIHFAGIVLLMLLMVVITYKDILKLLM